MKNISKSQLKPKMLNIFRHIEKTGEEYIVTDHGRPVLKISRYTESPGDVFSELRDSVLKYENPAEPVGVDNWDLNR